MRLEKVLVLIFAAVGLACSSRSERSSREWVPLGWVGSLPAGPEFNVFAQPAKEPVEEAGITLPDDDEAEKAREDAVFFYLQEPSSLSAQLELARAYFSGLLENQDQEGLAQEKQVPNNLEHPLPSVPGAALRVQLPASDTEPMKLSARGLTFVIQGAYPQNGDYRTAEGAVFYASGHFLATSGDDPTSTDILRTTGRVQEFFIPPVGAEEHAVRYELIVPAGVVAVRDAGSYLEFLDHRDVPILRMHYSVAVDQYGTVRHGVPQLHGADASSATPSAGNRQPVRYALQTRTLTVVTKVDLKGLVPPVVIDPGWTPTGSMAVPRFGHTATLLPSGKVLVAGGEPAGYSAELYDPATGTWSSTGSMVAPRTSHFAVLLPSGKVLVAGGGPSAGNSAELYDPATGTWSSTGSMATARFGQAADPTFGVLLSSGKVLVAGGYTVCGFPYSCTLATAELYDPATGTWSSTGSMTTERGDHTVTLLTSGKVLAAGGYSPGYLASAELYDPATGTWSSTGSMSVPRASHTTTLLLSGKVLVAGGYNGSGAQCRLASAELYDPATGTWSSTASMALDRSFHQATRLLNTGRVLISGGQFCGGRTSTTEIYDPMTGTWTSAGSMNIPRDRHTSTRLQSGKVLVAGGLCGAPATCVALGGTATGLAGFGEEIATSTAELFDEGSPPPAPDISVTPVPLIFAGDVCIGASQTQTMTVINVGSANLVIGSVTSPSAPFSITSDGCSGQTLVPAPAAGSSCTIGVQFAPTAAVSFSDSFNIPSNDPDENPVVVGLSGIGIGGDISVTPLTSNLGNVCLGAFSDQTVSVSNASLACNLTIGSVTLPGAPFSIVTDTCSGSMLVPAGSCTITVRYTPTAVSPASGTFNIPSDDPDENPVTVNLSGTGITADIDVSPTSYNFGNLCPAGSLTQTFTVSNVAASCNLSITSATGLGSPFGVTGDTCSGASLTPGASCGVTVQFAPVSFGSFSDTLAVASDDPDEPTVNIGVTGTAPPPDITVAPASYNFGDVCTGATATQFISVANSPTPSCPLNITAVGSPILPFSLTADSCSGASLPASGSCSVTAQFAPTATGFFAASAFGITSNDPDESPFSVFLSGTGITGADLIGAFTSISRVVRGGPRPHRVSADVQVSNVSPCGVGAGGSSVSLYLSSDAVFDPGDTFLDSNNVGPIAAGASRTTTFRVQFASNPLGQYLIAVVDSGSVIVETNEGNNMTAIQIP